MPYASWLQLHPVKKPATEFGKWEKRSSNPRAASCLMNTAAPPLKFLCRCPGPKQPPPRNRFPIQFTRPRILLCLWASFWRICPILPIFCEGWDSTPPTQQHAVPKAEHQSCHKSRHSFCEAPGIGSAALQGQYNPLLTLSVRVGFRSSPCLRGRFFPICAHLRNLRRKVLAPDRRPSA